MSTRPRRTVHVVALALLRTLPGQVPHVFVARRSLGRRHGGLWELPGGQVEPGETERQALVREIDEELGISVSLDERLGEATVDTGAIDVRMVVFVARQHSGTIHLVDHDDQRWLDVTQLDAVTWAPADIPHLPALARLLRGSSSGADATAPLPG